MAASTALQVVVSPFLGVVYENLSSLIQKEIGLVLGVNKELEKLFNTLSTIRDVLEDAEVKQIDDKPINNWLRKLKDLAYEADDILDECATEVLLPELDIVRNSSCNIQVTSPSDSSCFDFKGIMFRRSIGKRIKKLSEKFDEMAELRSKFHLNLTPKHAESARKEQRETSSFLSEPQVYGRKEETEHITNLLLEGGEEVSVCCIVGMGGLGKTTLAKMIYNDKKITNHFEVRCWVCVSDHFVLKTLLKSIIESTSTSGNARDLEDLDPLQCRVQGILSGKKFLLVLDDVWNEDQTKWYKLKSMLTCGGIGSSIIVTTRLESVASMTSTLPVWRLDVLSEEHCWSLFKHYAFEVGNEKYHPKLNVIGEEILKKCRGVPLAVKSLGGLLRFKKTEIEWLFVRDSALWDLPQDKEDAILPALRLSYNHLPSHLKQCFSYCSIFPKDYIMVKEKLIHLWMANGFVLPKGSMGLEDVGNEIFNELLWRSFFQDAKKDKNGDIMYCKMHDLMHDLACSITMNECTTVEVDKDTNVFKHPTRHLLLEFGFSSSSQDILNLWLSKSQPLLRTFFQINAMREHFIQELTFTNLKCLRVLDLGDTDITTLHVSISNLKHLRYLDLSYCGYLRSLPDESICKLRNLQVLKLNYCRKLLTLPENMKKMTNLRHLGITGCDGLRRMPVGMGKLSCLRTLSMFIVLPNNGCGISELEGLDHLRGKLEIKGLQHVKDLKDARKANLMRKKSLHELKLFWSEENNGNIEVGEEREEEVASIGEGLEPHLNIKKLHLECYNGLKFPSWMSHSCLPNLVEISLVGYRKCEHLPPLGGLAFLEILKISGMDSVKCIGDEFYGNHPPPPQGSLFPSLQQFEICNMPNLEDWHAPSSKEEENIKVFSSLVSLMLEGCPKLRTLPTTLLSAVTKLKLGGECNEMMLESSSLVKVIGCLQKLKIKSFNKIETLPKVLMENLPSTLTELCIEDCQELVCLSGVMQNLTSLNSFLIFQCPSLKYLVEPGNINNTVMTSVSELWIHGCPELEFLPDDFQDLTSLRNLRILSLPQITCLPEGLQQVAGTLEFLHIYGCSGLTSLPEWMNKFTSLQVLIIVECENLKVLPEEVLHLTSLNDMIIRDCHPDMHRRYAKETGEDWHKIAHMIPNLKITVTTSWKSRHGIRGGKKRSMKCINYNNNNSITSCFSSSSSGTNQ